MERINPARTDLHSQDMREQLLDALYGSVHEIPAWRSFLDEACHVLACDVGAVIIGSRDEGPAVQVSSCPPDEQAICFETFDHQPIPEFGGSEAVFRRPWKKGQLLLFAVGDARGNRGAIALCRGGDGATMGEDIEQIIRSIAAAFVRAIQIYFRITYLERRKSVLETTLETSRIGVILANTQGQVLLTNAVAERILAEGDGLRMIGGRLRAVHQSETADLMAELARNAEAQRAQPNWTRYTPVALTRNHHDLPLTVIVRPGPAFGPLREPLQRTAILILRDPALPPAVPAVIIARLFGLSPAEALLASELAKGADLEQAAAAIGVSRNTLRSQLQNIFLKTGTKRQVDLIRVLLTSAAMSIFSPEEPPPAP